MESIIQRGKAVVLDNLVPENTEIFLKQSNPDFDILKAEAKPIENNALELNVNFVSDSNANLASTLLFNDASSASYFMAGLCYALNGIMVTGDEKIFKKLIFLNRIYSDSQPVDVINEKIKEFVDNELIPDRKFRKDRTVIFDECVDRRFETYLNQNKGDFDVVSIYGELAVGVKDEFVEGMCYVLNGLLVTADKSLYNKYQMRKVFFDNCRVIDEKKEVDYCYFENVAGLIKSMI